LHSASCLHLWKLPAEVGKEDAMKILKTVLCTLVALAVLVLAAPAAQAGCLDVEKASAKDLEKLKGVGAKIAKAIINYRKKMRTKATKAKKAKWNFRNWATLMKVKGVGPKICKDNVKTVCFNGKVQKACPKK